MAFRKDLDLALDDDLDLGRHLTVLQEHIVWLILLDGELLEHLLLLFLGAALHTDLRWEYLEQLVVSPVLELRRLQEAFVDVGLDSEDDRVRLHCSDRLNGEPVEWILLESALGY